MSSQVTIIESDKLLLVAKVFKKQRDSLQSYYIQVLRSD